MKEIVIADTVFIVSAQEQVKRNLDPEKMFKLFFPKLKFITTADKISGVRWKISGFLIGTAEVWLEPKLNGTLLHFFISADVQNKTKNLTAILKSFRIKIKQYSFTVKFISEQGRVIGTTTSI